MLKKIILILTGTFLGLVVIAAGLAVFAVVTAYPRLPSLDALTDYRPKIPLRIYTADQVLIGEFGEERRAFVPIGQVPDSLKHALLSAEDERFYEHGGIDYMGVARAALGNIVSGHSQSGASTITMQVARNFYLTNEKTFSRKFNEALLSFKIEHSLSKDQILELYINQIYLGQRAYGFAAAAQTYYGKQLKDLTIGEAAMLAGLPKAPSAYNPVVNPKRARLRQQYVLRRMHELSYINDQQYQAALAEPIAVRKQAALRFPVHGEYIAEMVRLEMVERYQDAAYTQGLKVYTTVSSKMQEAAYRSLRTGLVAYDARHGYRGPERFVDPALLEAGSEAALSRTLDDIPDAGEYRAAIVTSANPSKVEALLASGESVEVSGDGLGVARFALSSKASPQQRIKPGAVIRVRAGKSGWVLTQLPEVEGALVSLDPSDGSIRALAGGFDFNSNHYNHVTQAWRQPGSSFKPFVYSAALERGVTPATLINDAPLVIDPQSIGGQRWEPKNYDGKFAGLMTVRDALTRSKNLVSIRILQSIGTKYAQQHLTRFGFSPDKHPAYLTMALGAGSVTPLQMAQGFSTFANGGYAVLPYFIERVEDDRGRILARMEPEIAGKNAKRTLDARNAFIMTSMMQDVVRYGTASKARVLGRQDLAGKTGTTNDAIDAWFAGYNPDLVTIVWVGFDQPRTLGRAETGGKAALPIWIDFMGSALEGKPERAQDMPDGVIARTVDSSRGPRTEYFYREYTSTSPGLGLEEASAAEQPLEEIIEQLF
ncbi:penicillin-binding protein 1A [Chitinibacteraceae bacterium HSL-7]